MPGVNRRFDGMEAAMRVGFQKLENMHNRQMHFIQENSAEGRNDAKRRRLVLATQLIEVAATLRVNSATIGGPTDVGATAIVSLDNDVIVGHDITGRKPQSVRLLYYEYFGLGERFTKVPVEGGLHAMESKGKEWRKHFTAADMKFFSRMVQVVESVDRQVDLVVANGTTGAEGLNGVLEAYDVRFTAVKKSLSAFIELLQGEGFIPKRCRSSR